MKRFLALLIIFCLFALPCHAGVTGSVSLANIRLSLVSTAPFVDFSASGTLTPYLHWRITLTDSAGKTAKARIVSAGTGETYTEIIVNGGFEGTYTGGVASNWTAGRGTPSEYSADPHAGSSSQQINNPAGNNGFVGPSVWPTAIGGALYKHGAYYKALVGAGEYRLDDNISGHVKTHTSLSSGTWTSISGYWTLQATATKMWLYLYAASHASADTNSIVWDSATIAQVLTPSATGVVTSAWTVESGFNYNDSGGYTYRLIPTVGGMLMGLGVGF